MFGARHMGYVSTCSYTYINGQHPSFCLLFLLLTAHCRNPFFIPPPPPVRYELAHSPALPLPLLFATIRSPDDREALLEVGPRALSGH